MTSPANTTAPHGSLAEAEAFCRAIASNHYENFTVATGLVPKRLRQHLANVYAFARWSDDLADEAERPEAAAAGLADWRRRLEDCFAGRPTHPVFVALDATIRQTGLSIEPFSNLLDAFEEDQAFDAAGVACRYASRAEVLEYCRRSADPVGRIVLGLEGCRDPELLAMSDSICTGLQLVNFWQDLKRDRRAGRVYLPRDDMRRHGVDETVLDGPRASPGLRALLRDEVAWARDCFAAGAPLAGLAPPVLRPAIGMFLAGGRAVADAIERRGYDTLVARPIVGKWKKLRLAARAWWALQTTSSAGSTGPFAGQP
ncbi:MAG: squalene synthase HpnC [Planctomycetia bacterium]|jgi:squalene synthase HpnC|nr:squalene synthase HpnC [Planctomycetia bacterium]